MYEVGLVATSNLGIDKKPYKDTEKMSNSEEFNPCGDHMSTAIVGWLGCLGMLHHNAPYFSSA